MLQSLVFTLSVALSIELPVAMAVQSADFDISSALLERGFNISAIPALANLADQSSVDGCSIACQALQYNYEPDAVDLYGDWGYSNFTRSFWSNLQNGVTPSCIFYPSSAPEVSVAVLLSRLTQCPFAVKSGGHAAFSGASNIEGGITVSLRDLNSIELSEDHTTAFIQPGNTWHDIYTWLQPYDLAVIGGRASPIGIGGLTTGGGISFFSNVYGLACDNVASYQVVTANGLIVAASPSQNADLYWALRGGGNNFGIVVMFELETIPLPGGQMWGGTKVVAEDQFPAVVDAFVDLIDQSPSDPHAGTWVAFALQSGAKLSGPELWYGKPDGGNAPIFDKFNNLTTIIDTTKNLTLVDYAADVGASNPYGYRDCFYVMSIKASHDVLQASQAVLEASIDIYFEGAESVQNITGAHPAMVWQAITQGELSFMTKNGGNPLGLCEEDGPYYIILLSSWWEKEEDDDAMYQMSSTMAERIKAVAVSQGVQNDFVYMNYASQFQDVIGSYGAENKAALKSIAAKYDPTEVFQTLQPGYFKLDRAPVPGTNYFSF